MNILISTTIVLISFLLIPFDANAHCKGKHTGDHEHCTGGGGGSEPGAVAAVEIIAADAIGNAATLHWNTPLTLEGGSDVATYEVRRIGNSIASLRSGVRNPSAN